MTFRKQVEKHKILTNGVFGILEYPANTPQFKQGEFIKLVNFDTGEECYKKVYENTKGKYFKHSGYERGTKSNSGSFYINSFNSYIVYVPFQILELD